VIAGPGLGQARGLAGRDRLALGAVGETADLDLVPLLLGRLLGQADARHLRRAVGAARDLGDVERVHGVQTLDPLDADHALVARLVRQPGRAGRVADRVHAGLAGAQPLVGDDVALFHLHLGALEPDVLDVAGDADGENHAIDLN